MKCMRSRMLICGLLIGLVMIGIVFAKHYTPVSAQDSRVKIFVSIKVQKGDTLWSIAKKNMTEEYRSQDDYIDEVCEINHICDDQINAGGYLVIPKYQEDK